MVTVGTAVDSCSLKNFQIHKYQSSLGLTAEQSTVSLV